MTTNEEWLTPKLAAERTRRHPQTIRRAIYAGDLPAYRPSKLPQGRYLISSVDLDRWVRGEPKQVQAGETRRK